MKKYIIKQLRALLDKLEPRHFNNRTLAYTDKSGNAYYTVPPEKLHGTRRVYLQTILDQMARGIDNDTLAKLINDCAEHVRVGKWRPAIDVLSNIEARTTKVSSFKLLGQAALVSVFIEGEPDEYTAHHAAEKTKLWNSDPDARFFFINWATTTFQNLPPTSIDDLKALEAVQDFLMTLPSTPPDM